MIVDIDEGIFNLTNNEMQKINKILPFGFYMEEKREKQHSTTKQEVKENIYSLEQQNKFKYLKKFQNNKNSEFFKKPVDPVKLQIPEYTQIIKQPMDLSTIESKIKNSEDYDWDQLNEDLKLIWKNAMLFNDPQSLVYS